MQTVGSGLWREHRKTWKNSNTHSRTWTLGGGGETSKNVKNEKRTLQDLEYVKKTEKSGK